MEPHAAMLVVHPFAGRLTNPEVVSSTLAADATVAPISRVEVTFSEKIVAQSAVASLEMIDMTGMRMNTPMK